MKKKMIAIGIVALILATGVSVAARVTYVYYNTKDYSNIIFPGVKIENVDLSRKTKEEARNLLNEKYEKVMLQKKINIKVSDKTYTIDYIKLNGNYNIDETVDNAFLFGKSFAMFDKYNIIKNPSIKEYKLKFTYDDKPLKDLIASISKDVDKSPVNAGIVMVNKGNFKVTSDVNGYKLNQDKLLKDVSTQVNGDITNSNVDVVAEINPVTANITAATLSTINTLVSSFNTNYSTSSDNRATNIELATSAINGKWLMPGDTFSFNDVVGQRTAEKGYKDAPVIVGNKVDSDLGGGICQVSSTLYNAVARANINAAERTHHTLPSSYVELGMDATVDYGNIDYKFKNTLNYPIYIEGYTQNRIVYFNVYSNSSLTKATYELVNEVYAEQQPNTQYKDDPTLPEGQEEVEQEAYVGYKVKVYRKKFENGTFIGQDLISDDTYLPVDKIIRRGTKKP